MIPSEIAQETKAATDEKVAGTCAFCLRSAQDGARLISQTRIDGVEEISCLNQFACAIAESDLREHHALPTRP